MIKTKQDKEILEKLWAIKKGKEIYINDKKLKVTKTFFIEGCHDEYCEDELTIYLGKDYALQISKDDVSLVKVLRPDKNTEILKKIKLNSIKL